MLARKLKMFPFFGLLKFLNQVYHVRAYQFTNATDLFRLTRFSGCYAMNDAKGYCDQIDHNVAILVLMVFRVPWMIARNMFLVH